MGPLTKDDGRRSIWDSAGCLPWNLQILIQLGLRNFPNGLTSLTILPPSWYGSLYQGCSAFQMKQLICGDVAFHHWWNCQVNRPQVATAFKRRRTHSANCDVALCMVPQDLFFTLCGCISLWKMTWARLPTSRLT